MNIKTYEGQGTGVLLLLSGVHGNEYTPIEALYQLEVDQEYMQKLFSIYKKIIFAHAVNEHGILNGIREYNPNCDLNRIYGDDLLKEKLKIYIDDADYIVDVHASKNCTEFVLINNDQYAKDYVDFCQTIGVKYAVWEGSPITIKAYALTCRKQAFTIECKGINEIDHKSLLKTMKLIKKVTLNKKTTINISEPYPDSQTLQTAVANTDGFLVWTSKKSYFIRSLKGDINNHNNIETLDKTIILRNDAPFIRKDCYLYQYQPHLR